MSADDDHPVDDRLRRAWADLAPADSDLVAAPAPVWAAIEGSVGPIDPDDSGEQVETDRGGARRPLPQVLLGAAAVLVVAALLATAWVVGRDDTPAADRVAVLSPDTVDGPADARGDVAVSGSGADRTLQIDLAGVPDGGDTAVVEVWLFDPDTGLMQAIGLVPDGSARLPVPPSVDLDRYRVVDVSLELLDGNAAHGAESLLRGDLTTA